MYKIKVSEYSYPQVIQTFWIREYHEKKLEISLDYEKLSYAPGDEVRGKITTKKMDGTPLPDTSTFTIQGLGVQIPNEKLD